MVICVKQTHMKSILMRVGGWFSSVFFPYSDVETSSCENLNELPLIKRNALVLLTITVVYDKGRDKLAFSEVRYLPRIN